MVGGVRMLEGNPGGVVPLESGMPGSGRPGEAGMPMYLRARSSIPASHAQLMHHPPEDVLCALLWPFDIYSRR